METLIQQIDENSEELNKIGQVDFDIFKVTQIIGRQSLMQAITFRVLKAVKIEAIVNKDKLSAFLGQIYKGYRRDVEYHNDIHGADVLEMTFFFMKQG